MELAGAISPAGLGATRRTSQRSGSAYLERYPVDARVDGQPVLPPGGHLSQPRYLDIRCSVMRTTPLNWTASDGKRSPFCRCAGARIVLKGGSISRVERDSYPCTNPRSSRKRHTPRVVACAHVPLDYILLPIDLSHAAGSCIPKSASQVSSFQTSRSIAAATSSDDFPCELGSRCEGLE